MKTAVIPTRTRSGITIGGAVIAQRAEAHEADQSGRSRLLSDAAQAHALRRQHAAEIPANCHPNVETVCQSHLPILTLASALQSFERQKRAPTFFNSCSQRIVAAIDHLSASSFDDNGCHIAKSRMGNQFIWDEDARALAGEKANGLPRIVRDVSELPRNIVLTAAELQSQLIKGDVKGAQIPHYQAKVVVQVLVSEVGRDDLYAQPVFTCREPSVEHAESKCRARHQKRERVVNIHFLPLPNHQPSTSFASKGASLLHCVRATHPLDYNVLAMALCSALIAVVVVCSGLGIAVYLSDAQPLLAAVGGATP